MMRRREWPAPQTQAERDADRIADMMAAPDYWRNPAKQAEVSGLFAKYYSGSPTALQPAPSAAPGVTDASLKAMMRDPRYADQHRRDPAFVAQVDAGWRALHPGDIPTSPIGRAE